MQEMSETSVLKASFKDWQYTNYCCSSVENAHSSILQQPNLSIFIYYTIYLLKPHLLFSSSYQRQPPPAASPALKPASVTAATPTGPVLSTPSAAPPTNPVSTRTAPLAAAAPPRPVAVVAVGARPSPREHRALAVEERSRRRVRPREA